MNSWPSQYNIVAKPPARAWRFTVRQLLGAMLALSIVSAAIRFSPAVGVSLAFAGLVVSAAYRQGKSKSAWVAAVIGGWLMMLALLFPAVSTPRTHTHKLQCSNNLKQIVLALHNYHADYGCFPPAYTVDDQGKPLLSWRVLILPYLEQKNLYDLFHLEEPWDSPNNLAAAKTMPLSYQCPSHPGRRHGITNYVAIVGDETLWPGETSVSLDDISDGAANTLLVVEWPEGDTFWSAPNDLPMKQVQRSWKVPPPQQESHRHDLEVNVAMADGHVLWIRPQYLTGRTLRALLTPAGKERLAPDWEKSGR